jgi:hypothetical protein
VVWQQVLSQPGTFLKHIVPAIVKPIHALWNEVVGFLFLSFATVFGFRTVTYVRQLGHANDANAGALLLRVVMAGFCTLLLGWFGVSSFLRARKISRS